MTVAERLFPLKLPDFVLVLGNVSLQCFWDLDWFGHATSHVAFYEKSETAAPLPAANGRTQARHVRFWL